MASYKGHSPAQWHTIVVNRATKLARRSQSISRVHIGRTREFELLISAVECLGRAYDLAREEYEDYRRRAEAARLGHRNRQRAKKE